MSRPTSQSSTSDKVTEVKLEWGREWEDALGPEGHREIAPKGWLTLCQIAKRMGVSKSSARIRVNRAMAKGDLECKRFYTRYEGRIGRVFHPVPHYRPVKMACKK